MRLPAKVNPGRIAINAINSLPARGGLQGDLPEGLPFYLSQFPRLIHAFMTKRICSGVKDGIVMGVVVRVISTIGPSVPGNFNV